MHRTPLFEPMVSRDEQLETLLERKVGDRVRDLRVLVIDRGIILQGRTETYHAKQLVEAAAQELAPNDRGLANDIEVACR